MARYHRGQALDEEERRFLRLTAPHRSEDDDRFYSYGPGLPEKQARGVPCWCCGKPIGKFTICPGEPGRGFLGADPTLGPEGVIGFCPAHAPLAYKDWPRINAIRQKKVVAGVPGMDWYSENPLTPLAVLPD